MCLPLTDFDTLVGAARLMIYIDATGGQTCLRVIIPSHLFMTSSDLIKTKILACHAAFEELNQQFRQEVEELEDIREGNKRLRAKVRWHKGCTHHRTRINQIMTSHPHSHEGDDQPHTNGGASDRKSRHDPKWRESFDPNRKIEVICNCCLECGGQLDESASVSLRIIKELSDLQPPEVAQYNRYHYEYQSCRSEAVVSHLDCPDEGQFGTSVVEQAALSRYNHRLPYQKIGDHFEQLHGLELSDNYEYKRMKFFSILLSTVQAK